MADASTDLDLDTIHKRNEYLTMHPTGPGWMQAPFDALDLLAEVERLCDGIRKLHAPVLNVGADTTVTHLCGRCTDEDGVLLAWPCPTAALLDDRTETT